ncbi:MAG: hypothetical protein U0V75_10665 [Ferruginibacter sp.]
MKATITTGINPLSKEEIKLLCTEVKETVLSNHQARKFTAADLWNIHRSRKTAAIKTGAF